MKINRIRIVINPGAEGSPCDVPVRCIHDELPHQSDSAALGSRAYLRRLRAAEMAAREKTGGDYLLSTHVPQNAGGNPSFVENFPSLNGKIGQAALKGVNSCKGKIAHCGSLLRAH